MTKERLKRYIDLKLEADQLRSELRELESAIYFPKIQNRNGMPAAASPENGTEKLIIRHLELQSMLEAKLSEIMEERAAIETAIDKLEPVERVLMRARYIDGLPWERVCVLINYEWSQTHHIHAQALNKLAEIEDGE